MAPNTPGRLHSPQPLCLLNHHLITVGSAKCPPTNPHLLASPCPSSGLTISPGLLCHLFTGLPALVLPLCTQTSHVTPAHKPSIAPCALRRKSKRSDSISNAPSHLSLYPTKIQHPHVLPTLGLCVGSALHLDALSLSARQHPCSSHH